MLQNTNVLFIGAGSMAEAMIAGMLQEKKLRPENVTAANRSNKTRRNELENKYNINVTADCALRIDEADIIILAVKPKDAEKVLEPLKGRITDGQLVLSVLAGISTSYIEEEIGGAPKVIRVMPNTSSMIGESSTAISAGSHVCRSEMETAAELLQTIGDVTTIEEKHMDVFTGLAGSGPAYIYYVIEHLEQVAAAEGMDRETARKIAAQMVLGAGKMVQSGDDTPADLRRKVTSPNGTTQAGLEALDENGGGAAFMEAVKNAAKRSKEISSQFEKKPVLL
ncbi:pyrroline-5-carboxylate reductase [Bacillus marinisedimentorum]|uniref:pyrroline-5-carboxylate reductase n=1 Tax=Bacillus marinisedimentorum TaxID=1821260 RepID=UPI000871E344|nr:pyrroline-5-carboxylate reductase [Bacillus marinisedimentorum]